MKVNIQNNSEIILYQTKNGLTKIEVRLQNETVWLSQQQLAELFQTTKQNISLHLKNIYEENELEENSTVKEYLTVRKEGNREVQRNLTFYNLDAIISVGYRIKSHIATSFRIWATKRLKEYIVKGFTLDDERLKEGGTKNNYFDELFERIRDIRTSERNFYQKITDIYTLSIDYQKDIEMTRLFYSTIQNKFHWAVTGKTAPEIIYNRVDAKKQNMGLTSWKSDRIRKTDVSIAKNYYEKTELEQYLSFAELQSKKKIPMYMKDWIKKLHDFLTINDSEILLDAGRISAKMAKEMAVKEYEKYDEARKLYEKNNPISDFDKEIKKIGINKK